MLFKREGQLSRKFREELLTFETIYIFTHHLKTSCLGSSRIFLNSFLITKDLSNAKHFLYLVFLIPIFN
jgi:hypothetical protein